MFDRIVCKHKFKTISTLYETLNLKTNERTHGIRILCAPKPGHIAIHHSFNMHSNNVG